MSLFVIIAVVMIALIIIPMMVALMGGRRDITRFVTQGIGLFVVVGVGYFVMQNVMEVLDETPVAMMESNVSYQDSNSIVCLFGDCGPSEEEIKIQQEEIVYQELDCDMCVKKVREVNIECDYQSYHLWNPVDRSNKYNSCLDETKFSDYDICLDKCADEHQRLLEQYGEWKQ